jgi:tetratricopeptide (TPR) repeat protein/tRNA A-37 threonylcarbamoyl transferase component Bud32
MAGNSESDVRDAGDMVRSVVLDVLRRRAAGELLPDEQVIASRPELADHLRVELAKLQQICAAGNGVDNIRVDASTAGMGADPTPGMFQVRCPHCREFFEAAKDTPVAEIVCSICGGHFNIAGSNVSTCAAPALQSLAHFDLVEQLGVGGFGSVWKAHDRKLDRTVAIKIPHRGKLNQEELEKFLREARAAAQLQHPNIVRVHEVGRDGDSAYIVSDFVRGTPLNDWLTGQQPTMRQAAEICATIADALQHAHDRGVIHRDLKPANTLIDGAGQPHLMDFGLARREVGEITVTLDGQVLGTPAYMSPEQARGEAHAADGRSDVYSLGVILFELITGELPFRGNPRMLMHQVIHDEPPSPRKFNSNLPKDLETITLKCLEKEPARRYQTAGELSDELKRYLAGEPIRARPITRVARTWRWARRRPAAAALLALLVFVAFGSAAAFVRERAWSLNFLAQKNEADRQRIEANAQRFEAQARKVEAESERDSAQAVVDFLTVDVLAKASPRSITDKSVRDTIVKALLEPAAATVGPRFQDKPRIEATVRSTIGWAMVTLGRADLALTHAERALHLRREVLGEDHPDTIESLKNYASVLLLLGRAQEAEPLFKQALEQRRKLLGDNDPGTIELLGSYAQVLQALGRAREAEPLHRQALEQSRRVLGNEHPDTIVTLNNYANTLDSLGRAEEAEPLLKEALNSRRKLLGNDHPDIITSLNNYAYVLDSLGRAREAEPLYKEALEQSCRVLGEDHPDTITSLNNYAYVLDCLGRSREAEPFYKQALESSRKVLGSDHPDTIGSLNNYARVLQLLGRFQEAELHCKQALAQSRKVLGENHPHVLTTQSNYAEMLSSLGRMEEAAALFNQTLETRRRLLGEDHPDTIASLNNYAGLLQSIGEMDDAEPLYREALERCRKVLGEDHPNTITSLNNYAGVLELLDRKQEAEQLFKKALEQSYKVLGEDHPVTGIVRKNYGRVLTSLGRAQEAESLSKQAPDEKK